MELPGWEITNWFLQDIWIILYGLAIVKRRIACTYIIEIRVCYLLHNNLHTGGTGALCIDVEGLDINPQLEQGNMSFGSDGL